MKTKSFYLALISFAMIAWSCSKSDDVVGTGNSASLKSSINTSVQNLNTALSKITSSTGYQLLSDGVTMKSTAESPVDSLLTNQILLSDIAGEYNYMMPSTKRGSINSQRFFTKVAENPLMLIRLPEEKVKNWKTMLTYHAADTALVNNYVISLSEYEYKFHNYVGWTYKMASGINVKGVDAGVLRISSSNNKIQGYKYSSEFDFAGGYKTICSYTTGDTIVSDYAITDGTKTLYEEKYTAIKTNADFKHREKEFSLTIGDVKIVRNASLGKAGLDSAKVYVAGVLQVNSKVTIVDKTTDPTATSVTQKKRELQITFDDGTIATFSQLAGAAITNISDLFTTMRQVTFSTNVVDWIAWDTYKANKK
ncbi:MAG: hypothetical protein PHV20_06975 [Bacteroidales bacterium]|nr:hypothetical protein [Bacteroidales bacterium]